MKLGDWFGHWGLEQIKLNIGFAEAEFELKPDDRAAAWDLYVEMLTRIVTQPLPNEDGDENTALHSVHSLFKTTRDILKARGAHCVQFTKVAIVLLNQIVRPFTAKWHRLSLAKAFDDPARCKEFRTELAVLQKDLRNYSRALADMAQVEDLTGLADKD
jgi:hypothetical protein